MLAHAGGADQTVGILLFASGIVVGWISLDRLSGTGSWRLPRWGAWVFLGIAPGLIAMSFFAPAWLRPRTPSGPRPVSSASIAFVEPSTRETVTGDELTIRLDLEGGRIVDATTTNLRPDTGHVHVSLDGQLLTMTSALVQVLSIDDLSPGAHRLQAEFVAADHAPFDPRVTATVTFSKQDR